MATGNSLVTDAMSKFSNQPAGTTPTTQELSDGINELNRMLGTWNAEMGPIFAETLDSLTWTAGAASMTIGTGGDFNVSRPQEIIGAQYRDASNVDYNMAIISHREYEERRLKTIQIIPYWAELAYNPTFPLGALYIYPVPVSSFTFRLNSLKPLADLTGAGTVSLPPGYEDAIVMNLAARLADSYGATVSQMTVANGQRAYRAIVQQNIQFSAGKMDAMAPGQRGGYNPRAYWNI